MKLIVPAILALLILSAGCLGVVSQTQAPTDCEQTHAASFWLPETSWDQNTVRIAYGLEGDVAVLFVVKVSGDVVGVYAAANQAGTVAVDGQSIQLDRKLTGTHTLRLRVYADTNRNQQLDNSDTRCEIGDTARVNFTAG
ncbi:MAG: hypothetical protein ABEI52_07515 [Halobacteriaceae archaeon]